MLGSCNAALRTVFEKHCSTSSTTLASYDVTATILFNQRNLKGLQVHCCILLL